VDKLYSVRALLDFVHWQWSRFQWPAKRWKHVERSNWAGRRGRERERGLGKEVWAQGALLGTVCLVGGWRKREASNGQDNPCSLTTHVYVDGIFQQCGVGCALLPSKCCGRRMSGEARHDLQSWLMVGPLVRARSTLK
jgi:hypothetical protein